MGYLDQKTTKEVYRAITAIGFDPASGDISLTISEGVDVTVDGRTSMVKTAPDITPNLAGSGSLLNTSLDQLLTMLECADLAALGALSTKQLIVRLVNAAMEQGT